MKAIQGQYIVSRLHTFICAADKRMLLNPFAVVQAKTSLDVNINYPLVGAHIPNPIPLPMLLPV